MPARVGLSPTPVSSRSASGCSVAATIHAAAVLMSPGTLTSTASRSPAGGVSVTAVPSVAMPAPIAPSMRSVWSRDRDGSTTVVGPSAARPASSSADLTCADATGVSMRCPPASGPPSITSGGSVPPARAVMRAPRLRRGVTMRPIGRRRSDPSPLSMDRNGKPASRPLRSRIVVPELPQSSTSAASRRPARPRPRTITRPSPRSSMSAPSARNASSVGARVGGVEEAVDGRLAGRDGVEEQRAVRNRLVAGHLDGAAQALGPRDGHAVGYDRVAHHVRTLPALRRRDASDGGWLFRARGR